MSDSALNIYASQRIDDLTLHSASFPGLVPAPDEIAALNAVFHTALQNQRRGDKSTTTAKNNARIALERQLLIEATNCAEIADGDLEKYQLSGFGSKSKGTAYGKLPSPENFQAMQGNQSGSMVCKFDGVKGNHGYELSIVSEDGSITKVATNSSSPVIVAELAPLKRYTVKCRAIGARNSGGYWSAEVICGIA